MADSLNILAFDTALNGIAIGAQNAAGQIHTIHKETEREQAALLIPLTQEALEAQNLSFQQLDAIICSVGPGSFTGLRIGLTTAKTLGLALDIPVIGLNTLDIMAAHYKNKGNLLVVLETKRQDFYACTYNHEGNALTDSMAATADEIIEALPFADYTIGGNCLTRFKKESGVDDHYGEEVTLFDPQIMVQLGQIKLESGKTDEPLDPLYLRGADTSAPKNPPQKLEGFA